MGRQMLWWLAVLAGSGGYGWAKESPEKGNEVCQSSPNTGWFWDRQDEGEGSCSDG